MEKEIKVGQSFDVVQVLADAYPHDNSLLKIGFTAVGEPNHLVQDIHMVPNGENIHKYPGLIYMSYKRGHVQRIGKLTITKVK